MNGRIFLSPPFVGTAERRAMAKAFASGYIAPCGPMVDAFERELAKLSGRRCAVAVTSGTAAIDLAMAELGVGRGWTVIAPSLTFIATVGPAFHRGAKLVFVDSDATGAIDVSLLEQALAEQSPKAVGRLLVMGVDLYGRCCDYAAISRLCRRYRAKFVCDSAEAVGAVGAEGRPAGSAGEMAIYSFNGNKIVTTSGGGALLTDDPGVAERARKRSQQSRENRPWYEHLEVGHNYRLSNLLASVGLAQLDRLQDVLRARQGNHAHYARFRGWDLLPPVSGENHWLTVALCADRELRDRLMAAFSAADVETRPVWKPMHLQPVFRRVRTYGGEVAESMFERGICLPSGTGLAPRDWRRIDAVLQEVLG